MRVPLLLAAILLCACASRQELPPGDALEDGEDGPAARALPPPPPPDEQERAFAAALEERDDPPPKEDGPPIPMPAASAVADPVAEARATATTATASARRALAAGNLDDAGAALQQLAEVAELAGPEVVQRLYELEAQLALKKAMPEVMEKAGWLWLRACGPTRVEACRTKALALLKRVPNAGAALKKRIAAVKEHDACVRQAEGKRGGDPPPPCAGEAMAFYRRDGDHLMVARLQLARAISAATTDPLPDAAFARLEQAEKACTEPRCLALRRSAHKWRMRLFRAKDDLEGWARAAIEDARLFASTVPAEQRRWARTPEQEQACAAFDAKVTAGACRRLEREILGDYTYRDYSQRQEKGEGLSQQLVREVNAHYLPSLEGCLQAQAQRLVPPSSESHGVRWVVGNDGRVAKVEMTRREQQQGPLAQCLRDQFALWRYPRYRGELQHVEQVFVVHARERR